MGLNLSAYFRKLLGKGSESTVPTVSGRETEQEYLAAASEYLAKELAFERCCAWIADGLYKTIFYTYQGGTMIRGPDFYRLNVQPNPNMEAREFWRTWVWKYFHEGEVLCVQLRTGRYPGLWLADSYTRDVKIGQPSTYRDISIGGECWQGIYAESQVMRWSCGAGNESLPCNFNVRTLVNDLGESYGKMLRAAYRRYVRSSLNKGVLTVSAERSSSKNFNEEFRKLQNDYFKPFYGETDSVIPIFEGYGYTGLSGGTGTSNSTSTSKTANRELRELLDDEMALTARAFGLPPEIFLTAENNTQAIAQGRADVLDPIAKSIAQKFTATMYGVDGYTRGDRVEAFTGRQDHVELLSSDLANVADKLIGVSMFSPDSLLMAAGTLPTGKPEGGRLRMSKNYDFVENFGQQEPRKEGVGNGT